MKTLLKLLIAIVIPFQFIISQPLDSLWMYYYGKDSVAIYALDITPKCDSGYLVVGKSDSWTNEYGPYIASIDKNGQLLWDEVFLSQDINDQFRRVIPLSDSNYLIGGSFNGLAWLVKMDGYGDTIWTKSYGNNFGLITSLQLLSNDDLIITGEDPDNSYHFYLMKTNQYGDTIWTRKHNINAPFSAYSSCVRQTPDEGFILSTGRSTGYFYSIAVFVKTDNNGDTLWTIDTHSQLSIVYTSLPNILMDSDTMYFIGSGMTGSGGQNVILIKMEQEGEILWMKDYGYSGSMELGYSGVFSTNGNLIIAGEGSHRIYILEIDKSGNLIWDTTYGTMGHTALSIKNTLENNYIITGVGIAPNDFFVFKLGEEPSGVKHLNNGYFIEFVISPNPVSTSTTIRFDVFERGIYRISVYDLSGNRIKTLMEQELSQGSYKYPLNISELSNGVYLVSLESKGFQKSQKIIITR